MRRAWLRWCGWFLSVAGMVFLAVLRLHGGPWLQTDVTRLLPTSANADLVTAGVERSRAAFSQELLVLLQGPATARMEDAARAVAASLRGSGLELDGDGTGGAAAGAMKLFLRHRFALLGPAAEARLAGAGAQAFATDVAVGFASPAGIAGPGTDLGGYVQRYLEALPRPYPDFVPGAEGLVAHRGGSTLVLLRARLPGDAFGEAGPAQGEAAVAAARDVLAAHCAACTFHATGVALFSAAASRAARTESIWLGSISTILVMLLIALVFRSVSPHLLGFLQLFSSVIVAASAVIVLFGSINVITLVFGTTLIGIAIDYAFLYFSEYWFAGGAPDRVMQRIRPGLLVGLVTGCLAFAFMLATGFPAFAQMAVFSIAGLIEAALVVVWVFPVVLTRAVGRGPRGFVAWPARFMRFACRSRGWRIALPIAAVLVAAPGLLLLHGHDDVRELSTLSPRLLHEDATIRNALGSYPADGFFLVQGRDLPEALSREGRLFTALDQAVPGAIPMGLSRFVPTRGAQARSLAAWRGVFADPRELRAAFVAMGLPAALAERAETSWTQAPRQILAPREMLAAVPALDRFVLRADGKVALMATVFAPRTVDRDTLARLAGGIHGIDYVQPMARINHLLARIRTRAAGLVLLGYLAISVLLMVRYGLREAGRMLYPPLLALLVTLGWAGLLGIDINVFAVIALILILGLGRDYAIFLREMGADRPAAALAVTLSALTTLFAFGLLAFSAIPALHAFGVVTLIGIAMSYLVAPLSVRPEQS